MVCHRSVCITESISTTDSDWTGSSREVVTAALQNAQSGWKPAASAAAADAPDGSPSAAILGVWLASGSGVQQSQGQQQQHFAAGVQHAAAGTPQRRRTAAAVAPDSIARRTRSRAASAKAAAGSSGEGSEGGSAAATAGSSTGQWGLLPGSDDSNATVPVHIVVAHAPPNAADGTSSGSRGGHGSIGRGGSLCSGSAGIASAAGTADLLPRLHGIWLGGEGLSPDACHVIMYRQPACRDSHLNVGTAASGGGAQDATMAAAVESSNSGGGSGGAALQSAVRLMNRGHQLMATVSAAAVGAAAAAPHQQLRLLSADAIGTPESDANVPPPGHGRLAHSELWRELRHAWWRRCNSADGMFAQLAASCPQPAAAVRLAAASARTPPADAAASNAALLRRWQQRSTAALSHAAGLTTGGWLLWRRQAVAAALTAQAAALAWGFIDPQATANILV